MASRRGGGKTLSSLPQFSAQRPRASVGTTTSSPTECSTGRRKALAGLKRHRTVGQPPCWKVQLRSQSSAIGQANSPDSWLGRRT